VKRALLIGLGVLVLATLVVVGIRRGGGPKGTRVYAEAAARRDIAEVVKASGEIDPRIKVNISSPLIAKIEKMYVEEGDQVVAGRPFLDLEKEAYVAQRDQWRAQLRSAQTAVRKAEVTLADSRNKLARARRLTEDGILSREQMEASELQETSARLSLDEAREAVRQAQANLDKALDDLSKTTIYAPLTGTVIKLNAEEGEVVVSGTMNNPASVIGTVADLSEILARVDVDETEVVDVRLGQQAVLNVDALPGKEYHGAVVEIGSSGVTRANQPDVTFFEVKILLSDADPALRPGMSVRAEIQAASHPGALVVPIQAVVERPPLDTAGDAGRTAEKDEAGGDEIDEIKVVFVVESGGKAGAADKPHPTAKSRSKAAAEAGIARQRPVTTGISNETHVEITAGLKVGERVVTGPYRTLRDLDDGDAVVIGKPSDDRKAKKAADEDKEKDEADDEADPKDEEER
jgi:HlyD family secretion protein